MQHFLEQSGYKFWDCKEDWVGKYQIITNKYQKRVDQTDVFVGSLVRACVMTNFSSTLKKHL